MPQNHRFFRAHGLEFDSDVSCAAASAPGGGPPDVRVRFGPVPERIEGGATVRGRFELGRDEVVVRTRTIADYWIRHGSDVTVAPREDATAGTVGALLLG